MSCTGVGRRRTVSLPGGAQVNVPFSRLDSAVKTLQREGWVVIESVLNNVELAEVKSALSDHYPTVEEFDAGGEHAGLATDMWGGLVWFPFANHTLNNLAVHPRITAIAERVLETRDVLISRAAIHAKFAVPGVDYSQVMHFDFGNHTLVVPRQEPGYGQVEGFLYLEDVTVELGATRVVPRTVAGYDPYATPQNYIEFTHPSRESMPELYEAEVAAVGPAGSFFVFTPDVLHRAAPITAATGRRVTLSVAYSTAGVRWLGYTAWPRLAEETRFTEFIEQATPRQRELFGFPPPGDRYWTSDTFAGVSARYPNMDMSPYLPNNPGDSGAR